MMVELNIFDINMMVELNIFDIGLTFEEKAIL